jgi:Tfp pilus assembly protein PilO
MRTLQSQIGWCAKAQLILGASLLLVCAAYYPLVHRPAAQRSSDLQMQMDTKQRELRANQSRNQVRRVVERKVADLRSRLVRFDRKLPKQQELDQFLRELTRLSQQSALRGWESSYQVPKHRQLLIELPIELTFEGDFLNAFSFLRQMEQMERLTRVRSLSVRSAKGAKGEPGQVAVELAMSIFFLEG